ncbi:MAG: hypothetical protein VB108_03445 [Anaerolineaceae bacterium]|nr:hypothetical protein [Anaerolineaceae bacterium]
MMHEKKTTVLFILFLLCLHFFCLLIIPNQQASENLAMVSMLEPDEGVVIPVMQRMISGGATLKEALGHFIVYEYYYYGMPFFGLGALIMLVLRGLGLEGNFPLMMTVLRQLLSVLPTLAALLLITYIQDQFKSWRSAAIFLLLAILPATMRNAFWLHPDGLVLFFCALVLYLLWKDEHRLGKEFRWAAVVCGLLTATKLVGFYFFLAVLLCLIWYVVKKQGTSRHALASGLCFMGLMTLTFVLSNAFLFSSYGREQYYYTLRGQAEWLNKGYGIIYPKGLAASLPIIKDNYGSFAFILLALVISLYGLSQKTSRFLAALVLAWVLPLSISVFFFTHFKYQYWLPVALPLFSNFAFMLPVSWRETKTKWGIPWVVQLGLIIILLFQAFIFIEKDIAIIRNRLQAMDNNPKIRFYHESIAQLQGLKNQPQKVYYDYRLYLPPTGQWQSATSYDLLNYPFIQENQFTILMLSAQRIADYLNPNAVGIDPAQFAESQRFYRDAQQTQIEGFHLLYQDSTGLLFIRNDVCKAYFPQENCLP